MPPPGEEFRHLRAEIDWLRQALADRARYPILSERVLPRLQRDLDEGLRRWSRRGGGYLFPPIVLSVDRWRAQGADPRLLLDRLETGLRFNQGNRAELGNLTGNFWDPQLAASTQMQLLVTASLLQRTGPDQLKPVTQHRPDLWVSLDGRDVGIEITSRNVLRDLRQEGGGWGDPQEAADDFWDLWNGPVASKQADYDGSFPIVLVLWDCEMYRDVYDFVTRPGLDGIQRSFYDLLDIHRPDCTPFSAIVYLPYINPPQIALCNGRGRGMTLTDNEAAGFYRLFDVNPVSEQGFLPPQA